MQEFCKYFDGKKSNIGMIEETTVTGSHLQWLFDFFLTVLTCLLIEYWWLYWIVIDDSRWLYEKEWRNSED